MIRHSTSSLTSVLLYCSYLLCFSAVFYFLAFWTLNTSQVGLKEVSSTSPVTTLQCLQNTRLYDSGWLVLMLIQHRIKRGATAGF